MSWPSRISLQSRDPKLSPRWSYEGEAIDYVVSYDARLAHGSVRRQSGESIIESADPFILLDWMSRFDLTHIGPDARWVGYLGYELAGCIERLAEPKLDATALPTFSFWLTVPRTGDEITALASPTPAASIVDRSMSRDVYLAAAARSIDYIAAGDVFQINLAHRLSVKTTLAPHDVWQRLTTDAAADYGAYIDCGDHAIISNSPELFFAIRPQPDGRRTIINRPIKGTRPNAPGMAAELAASVKDQAELAMIVDLQRNDLGRVCEIGSVIVREPRVIETHPTVIHGVATIEGTLRRDASFSDIIRALFPCGSITGCPKVRAMEIIHELEPVARGPYCGGIGYLAADGSAEFNVAIRTLVMADGVAQLYVGGGIVADSSPEAEYEETLVKARAMLAALGVDAATVDP